MKVAVIGAGPAGLTSAYLLSRAGVQVDVYEAGAEVGGMCKTIELWGQKVDIGPHRFFSNDTRVNQLWLDVVRDDYEMVDRLTRIYYKNRFFYYPIKPFDALFNLGVIEALSCLVSYGRGKMFPIKQDGSFEDWVVSRFGRRLFEIFFKTYSEKLWGITCKELDSEFAAQRIKKLSLFEALKSAITGGGRTEHKTLVDQFAYPVDGTGMVYNRMARSVVENGGQVLCNQPVYKVISEGNEAKGLALNDGRIVHYDHVISTMPLTQMVMRLDEVPSDILENAKKLKFRNTILVFLNVNSPDLFPDNWLYVHSKNLGVGRISNFRNWVPQMHGSSNNSILALEYWCYDEDELWGISESGLIVQAQEEIKSTGLIKGAEILDGFVYKIHRSYPVYGRGYKRVLEPIEKYLSNIRGLSVIGRYGAFKYNNQDHSILMGILAAENIVDGKQNNLWEVNTDYEYQESSVITKTGLIKQAQGV